MNTLEVTKPHTNTVATRTMNPVLADQNGQLPDRIEVLKAGSWGESIKGSLEITMTDLHEYVENFNRGIGLPGSGVVGLPVDFSHESDKGAAFWIKALEVVGDILYASQVEYTTPGKEALLSGEFKCFSPSFYPACLGQWYDPEDPTVTARNVLVGGGLTNIPFFKGLKPIMASQTSQEDGRKNVIYISADTKGDTMDLAQVRTKPAADLTAEEKTFLTDHKAELTADEQVAFGLNEQVTPPAPAADEDVTPPAADAEAAAVQASIKSGKMVLVEAARFSGLEAQVEASAKMIASYEKERIEASVETHIARGAIKADQKDAWTKAIIASAEAQNLLSALPDNVVLASEIGHSDLATAGEAGVQMEAKIQEAVTASQGKLSYSQAAVQVATANPELSVERQKEFTK